jgi:hypothetical protein
MESLILAVAILAVVCLIFYRLEDTFEEYVKGKKGGRK